MLLLILGAGASYDAIPTIPVQYHQQHQYRLPLANHLFDRRYHSYLENFEQGIPIIPYLQALPSGLTVEKALQQLQEETVFHKDRFSQLLAIKFYLQHLISELETRWTNAGNGVLNHWTLMDQVRSVLGDQPVITVTFNYDRIIDKVLERYGRRFETVEDYVRSNNYPLFKLHGSVNWGRRIESTKLFSGDWKKDLKQLIDDAESLMPSRHFVLVENVHTHAFAERGLYPAIAIPLESKTDYECPSDHISDLTQMLHDVDRVIIIGWRAADKPFVELISQIIKRDLIFFIVCGSEEDINETISNLNAVEINGTFHRDASGFTNATLARVFEKFLRS
jgi:hypothetical protein